MAAVSVTGLGRVYGAHRVLGDVTIAFPDGGFYALLGPSGSGKTTLLRLIAGFDRPDEGRITIGGEAVEAVPVERRRIGMVFQNYALFPNMSVEANVGFGLSVAGRPREEIAREVSRVLDLVQLGALAKRRPSQLSGGQKQRVALARAIVTRPRVLLLDEPLAALDKALRTDMQTELKRIQREVGITTIFVTHDQEEALTMADRIGLLKDGRLVEEGTPEALYDRPATAFAAGFLGEANLLSGIAEHAGLRLSDGRLVPAAPDPARATPGAPATCAIRPERIRLVPAAAAPDAALHGRIAERIFFGAGVSWRIDAGGLHLRARLPNVGSQAMAEGEPVAITWDPEAAVYVA